MHVLENVESTLMLYLQRSKRNFFGEGAIWARVFFGYISHSMRHMKNGAVFICVWLSLLRLQTSPLCTISWRLWIIITLNYAVFDWTLGFKLLQGLLLHVTHNLMVEMCLWRRMRERSPNNLLPTETCELFGVLGVTKCWFAKQRPGLFYKYCSVLYRYVSGKRATSDNDPY